MCVFDLNEEISWQVRKKRAKYFLTKTKASKEIGISRRTLGQIEAGELSKVSKTVFVKLANWLLTEKEG